MERHSVLIRLCVPCIIVWRISSHLHLLLSVDDVPLAVCRIQAKLQGAVAVNYFEDQIAANFFAEEDEDDDIKMKEIIERYSYGRMSGKSGKSIRSCTKRLLNDCYQ
jgi:hypothetical protein